MGEFLRKMFQRFCPSRSFERSRFRIDWRLVLPAMSLLFSSVGSANGHELKRFDQSEQHMGTRFEIVAYAPSSDLAEQAFAHAFSRIRELDQSLSNYLDDSELNRLCDHAPHETPQAVSADLFHVLQISTELSRRSGGAFDVTIGPVSKLWRRARRQRRLPTPQRLSEAMRAVGYKGIELHQANRSVRLTKAGTRIDLGAIGKGYAIDQALKEMSARGVPHALVNGGGDIAVSAPPPDKQHWIVRVQGPDARSDRPIFLKLANQAVATSGDLYQVLEVNGKRYSHLIDPNTGMGVTRCASSTVISPTATMADGLASALAVMGSKKGIEFIESYKATAAIIIEREGNKLVTTRSKRFLTFEHRRSEEEKLPSLSESCEEFWEGQASATEGSGTSGTLSSAARHKPLSKDKNE